MSTRKTDTLLVEDVMLSTGNMPVVPPTMILKEALEDMEKWRLGIICITDDTGFLQGILTDGDIRRKLLKVQKPMTAFFIDDVIKHAVASPVTTRNDATLLEAINLMEERQIWDLPVLDGDGKLVGLLHLHPAVQKLLDLLKTQ